jgi:hypothetical protein
MTDTITALASILRNAQGVYDAESRREIDVGAECMTIREEHDELRREIERLRAVEKHYDILQAMANEKDAEIERLRDVERMYVEQFLDQEREATAQAKEIERLQKDVVHWREARRSRRWRA